MCRIDDWERTQARPRTLMSGTETIRRLYAMTVIAYDEMWARRSFSPTASCCLIDSILLEPSECWRLVVESAG